jgi:hypothetical protein
MHDNAAALRARPVESHILPTFSLPNGQNIPPLV